MKKFIFLILILAVLLLAVACGNEAVTTAPETTADAVTTNLPQESTMVETTTLPVTSTAEVTEAPDTAPDTKWMAKIEPNFFEKAVEKDGKYYIYMTYRLDGESDNLYCNQQFVDAFVPDHSDIVFANLDRSMASGGIYLRATAEEIETYAQNDYVFGIYSYPADKVIDNCQATIERMDSRLMVNEMQKIANCGGSLPMLKINSKEELAAFVDACIYDDSSFIEEMGWTGLVQSAYERFEAMTAIYDDAYFAEKTLFLIGAENGTGSANFSLIHVLNDDGIKIVLDLSCPFWVTDDMAYWLIFVEVDNTAIENQTSFEVIVK